MANTAKMIPVINSKDTNSVLYKFQTTNTNINAGTLAAVHVQLTIEKMALYTAQ